MKQLLIVAHVPSPNTQRLADACLEGAQHPDIEGVNCRLLSPFDTTPDDVLSADGIVLGTTENLGTEEVDKIVNALHQGFAKIDR